MSYVSTGMGNRFGVLVVSLMALQLALVDRNPFRPCFLSPDFHELWRSVMSICLFTEVKQQWAMLVTRRGDCPSSRPAMGCV